MKFFGLLSLMYMVWSSHQEDENCPKNITLWKEKEARINCGKDKLYHCLRDEGERVKESCLRGSWIQPGFCPEFNSVANEIDVFLCKESMGKCPDATYWSNELYRYSACLKAVSMDANEKVENLNDKQIMNDSASETGMNVRRDRIFIIVGSILGVIISVIIGVAIHCLRKGKRRPEQQKNRAWEDTKKELDAVDSLLQSKGDVPFTVRDETSSTSSHGMKGDRGDLNRSTRDALQLSTRDDSNTRLTSATSDTLSIPKNYTQYGRDYTSLMRREDMSISATTEVVNISSTDETNIARSAVQWTKSRAERIDSLIQQHLCEPGTRLLLIVSLHSDIDTVELELKKKPYYLKIDSFDDWWKTSDKEGYYVLLSCISMELILTGNLDSHRNDLSSMASDIEKMRLRAVIPVKSEMFKDLKHHILRFDLFRNLEPIEI